MAERGDDLQKKIAKRAHNNGLSYGRKINVIKTVDVASLVRKKHIRLAILLSHRT